MVADPAGLLSAAREFVMGFYRLALSHGEETPAQSELLAQTFRRLDADYGVRSAGALQTWAERFDVDRSRRRKWSDWQIALIHLASAFPGQRPTVPEPLGPEVREACSVIIRKWIGPAQDEHIQQLRADAEAQPLTDVEVQVLAPEPMLIATESLSAALDGLEVICSWYATYRALGELWVALDRDSWQRLTSWAVAERSVNRSGTRAPIDLDLTGELDDFARLT
jgi:hypothetical protein